MNMPWQSADEEIFRCLDALDERLDAQSARLSELAEMLDMLSRVPGIDIQIDQWRKTQEPSQETQETPQETQEPSQETCYRALPASQPPAGSDMEMRVLYQQGFAAGWTNSRIAAAIGRKGGHIMAQLRIEREMWAAGKDFLNRRSTPPTEKDGPSIGRSVG